MAISHTWTTSVKVPGLATLPSDGAVVVTGDYAIDLEAPVAAGATVELDVGTITLSKIQSLILHSDQVNVTVNTNDVSGTSGQTIDLGAAKAIGWNNTLSFPNPLTSDISKFFVTNNGSKSTTFRAGFLLNA